MTLPLPVVLDFKAYAKGTLRGFFDIELASGMIVRGCSLHKKNDHFWIGLPAKPYVNSSGEQAWCRIIDFSDDATRKKFQQTITPLAVAAYEQTQKRGAT